MTEQAKAPLEHYRRAQELLAKADDHKERDLHFSGWFEIQVQLAHLHLRAAEVGAAQEFCALRRARLREMTQEASVDTIDQVPEC